MQGVCHVGERFVRQACTCLHKVTVPYILCISQPHGRHVITNLVNAILKRYKMFEFLRHSRIFEMGDT